MLVTNCQLPVFVLIAMPIFPGEVLVVGSTFEGLPAVSVSPTKALLPDCSVLSPKRIVKKNPPSPAAFPLQTCNLPGREYATVPAVVPVLKVVRTVAALKFVVAGVGLAHVPEFVTNVVPNPP